MTEHILDEWLAEKRVNSVDLLIAGRVFGGRIGDRPQRPVAFQVVGPVLLIRFDRAERLVIVHPSAVQRAPDRLGSLVIPDAQEARFGWYDYLHPPSPETWCEVIYRRQGTQVEFVRLSPRHPAYEVLEYTGDEFIKLYG